MSASFNQQVTGTRIQDSIQFLEEKRDKEPCAVCDHFLCMPVNETDMVVNAENAASRQDYDAEKMTTTGKMKAFSGSSAHIGCFCFKQNCLLRDDGAGCG